MRSTGDIYVLGNNLDFRQQLIGISKNYWKIYHAQPSHKVDSQTISKSVSKLERDNFYNNEYANSSYGCNTWEYDDGSKYCGYLAREGGKFGSYPLCDDYGENAFP